MTKATYLGNAMIDGKGRPWPAYEKPCTIEGPCLNFPDCCMVVSFDGAQYLHVPAEKVLPEPVMAFHGGDATAAGWPAHGQTGAPTLKIEAGPGCPVCGGDGWIRQGDEEVACLCNLDWQRKKDHDER